MAHVARSPREQRLLGPGGIPTSEQLHGKEWHMGDPHSRYRFIRVLGTGHYGVTYLCSSLNAFDYVAVKALDKLHPEYERELAVEEVLILAAVCDHPNVVNMYEVWEDASYIFIVMEACMGGELFDMVIERKHFTEADAASITAAVLSVMQHCHSKGIIHRDLKPENFLLLREGELSADNLRAIDFGLSKFVGHKDGICRTCVGSSYYVAPEVLKGAYSYEADAWSVGCITYILLSGFPPFWGSSDQIIFHRILNKPVDFDYQPWHQISAAAKDFVGRLLHKDAAQRLTVEEGLMHPWITDKAADVPLSTDIITRLQSFTHQNRVKCLLLAVAAHHLSDEEIGGLRKIFHFIDADQDGEISMHDLTVALQHTGLDMEQQGIMALLAGLDLAHHGKVHIEEFLAAALDQRKVLNAKTVNGIFTELDHDNDGLITVKELKEALEECKISIKADTLSRLMDREGALDSKGMVSAKSFSSLLMGGESAEPLELETWMQDVHQFSSANSFKQLAMLVVARHMQPAEVDSLRRLFQHLDEDATGTISMAQLQEALRHMGREIGEPQLRELLEALDIRQHGVIEYDEFLAACLEEQHLTETKLRAAFDFFDRDRSGLITETDVAQVLKEVGMDAGHVDEMMVAASGGGSTSASCSGSAGDASPASTSRSISYEDFRRLLLSQPPGIITTGLSGDSPAVLDAPGRPAAGGAPHPPPGRRVRLTTSVDRDSDYGSAEGSPQQQQPQAGRVRFEPPSPISLMPRYEPPSPINLMARAGPPSPLSGELGGSAAAASAAAEGEGGDGQQGGSCGTALQNLLQRHSSSGYTRGAGGSGGGSGLAPFPRDVPAGAGTSSSSSLEASPQANTFFAGMPGPDPPSPISLMPRYEPPSPLSLLPKPEPASPSGDGGVEELGGALRGASGSCGTTLQRMLQDYIRRGSYTQGDDSRGGGGGAAAAGPRAEEQQGQRSRDSMQASPQVTSPSSSAPNPEPPSPNNNTSAASRYQPPSPISLLPKGEPPTSPEGGIGGGSGLGTSGRRPPAASPSTRPGLAGQHRSSKSSPMLGLTIPRHAPVSPMAGGGLSSSGGTPGSGAGGMTLHQILQQYSSSGYTRGAGSRRASLDVARDSIATEASEGDAALQGNN